MQQCRRPRRKVENSAIPSHPASPRGPPSKWVRLQLSRFWPLMVDQSRRNSLSAAPPSIGRAIRRCLDEDQLDRDRFEPKGQLNLSGALLRLSKSRFRSAGYDAAFHPAGSAKPIEQYDQRADGVSARAGPLWERWRLQCSISSDGVKYGDPTQDASPDTIRIRLKEIAFAWHETPGAPPNADAAALRQTMARLAQIYQALWPLAHAASGRSIPARVGSGCVCIAVTKGPSATTTLSAPMARAKATYRVSYVL